MKTVNKSRLDKSKATQIRTFRGASVKNLTDIINSSESPFPHVENVSLCIGSINCSRRYIDEANFIDEYEYLLQNVKKAFPNAKIAIIAIPPQSNKNANKWICKINVSLKSLAKRHNIHFGPCSSLWMHVNNDGCVDDGILVDRIHLSPRGVGLLLRPVTAFFFNRQRYSQMVHSTDDVGSMVSTESSLPNQMSLMKNLSKQLTEVISSGLMSIINHGWSSQSQSKDDDNTIP